MPTVRISCISADRLVQQIDGVSPQLRHTYLTAYHISDFKVLELFSMLSRSRQVALHVHAIPQILLFERWKSPQDSGLANLDIRGWMLSTGDVGMLANRFIKNRRPLKLCI